MGLVSKKTKAGLVCLALVGAAGAALVSGGSMSPGKEAELSSAEVIALRFPSESEELALSTQDELTAARDIEQQTLAILAFNPDPLGVPGLRAWGSVSEAVGQRSDPIAAAAAAETTESVAATPPGRPAQMARPKRRPATLFNDAQIASIKERLRLSPEQEQYWPRVEAALRYIGWRHSRERTATRLPTLEPDDVERVKAAAVPLITSLREDQKREVRVLAHVMGLERIAAQF
jgi:hypothetical protein